MKVVHGPGKGGLVTTASGRGGGLGLGRPADVISIGEVVCYSEAGLDLVDCEACVIAPACVLTGLLNDAMNAFLAVLEQAMLTHMLPDAERLRRLFLQTSNDPA
jgi:Rrf2 family nitric oxide-sensitive transcriptional repressor